MSEAPPHAAGAAPRAAPPPRRGAAAQAGRLTTAGADAQGVSSAAPGRKRMRLSVAANPVAVRQALLSLHAALLRAGVPVAVAENLQIVLAEMLNNTVEHGYGGRPDQSIALSLGISDTQIDCAVRDSGISYPSGILPAGLLPASTDDVAPAPAPAGQPGSGGVSPDGAAPTAGAGVAAMAMSPGEGRPGTGPAMPTGGAPDRSGIATLPEGGFGWHLIRSLADDLRYQRRADRNELRFRIPFDQGQHLPE